MNIRKATIWTAWGTIALVVCAGLPLGIAAIAARTSATDQLAATEKRVDDHETRLRLVEGDIHEMRVDVRWIRDFLQPRQNAKNE